VLRSAFNWGTQRIKVNIENQHPYILHLLETVNGEKWKPIRLSRQAINNVLKKHKLNGSPYGELWHWRRFQAERPDALWQIDIRGPFSIGGERKLALVRVDDNSRFLVSCTLHKNITSQDVIKCLKAIIIRGRKPTKVLVDFGLQFRKGI
jgi:transposase InsO family protein